MITNLREALEHATRVYGQPIVAKSHPDVPECDSVLFGDMNLDGKHATEFIVSGDCKIVYYRRDGMKLQMFDGSVFTAGKGLADRMCAYVEQFAASKPKPKLEPCLAIAPLSHFVRINVFNQYQDAAYSVLIRENASTYAMGMPI